MLNQESKRFSRPHPPPPPSSAGGVRWQGGHCFLHDFAPDPDLEEHEGTLIALPYGERLESSSGESRRAVVGSGNLCSNGLERIPTLPSTRIEAHGEGRIRQAIEAR